MSGMGVKSDIKLELSFFSLTLWMFVHRVNIFQPADWQSVIYLSGEFQQSPQRVIYFPLH